MPQPAPLSGLSRPELEALLLDLFGKVTDLEKIVAEQREEIARLKGLKGRPDIKPGKPSGMDKATDPAHPGGQDKKRFRGKVAPRVAVEARVVEGSGPGRLALQGLRAVPGCRTW